MCKTNKTDNDLIKYLESLSIEELSKIKTYVEYEMPRYKIK